MQLRQEYSLVEALSSARYGSAWLEIERKDELFHSAGEYRGNQGP
jgi:hypothetical protein